MSTDTPKPITPEFVRESDRVVAYIDIGDVPPEACLEFMERLKAQYEANRPIPGTPVEVKLSSEKP